MSVPTRSSAPPDDAPVDRAPGPGPGPGSLPARTPPQARTSDVLVVGAGIIGAAVARAALHLGLGVTLLDPDPGAGSTFAAAGMLAPVTEATFGEDALTALCVASARLWPDFAAELTEASGTDLGFETSGTLTLGYDRADAGHLERLRLLHARLGLRSEQITVAQAREREPFLGPHLSSALWVEGDHQVDPRAVHRALLCVLEREDRATLVRSSAVELLLGTDGRAVGVLDAHGGVHHAGTVVLAAGTSSGRLVAGLSRVRLPVRAVSGQTLRLRTAPGFDLRHVVRGTVQMRPVYIVPRAGGDVVVGATSEERAAEDLASAGGVFTLLRDARALVPGIDELSFLEVTNRGRPGTPDNLPIVGATSVPGLLAATGHFRNGILLTPLTAAALAPLLGAAPGAAPSAAPPATDDLAAVLAAADPRRFDLETTR